MTVELDDLEGLTLEIQRLIENNRKFLERVVDEDFEDDEPEGESSSESDAEDFEEL